MGFDPFSSNMTYRHRDRQEIHPEPRLSFWIFLEVSESFGHETLPFEDAIFLRSRQQSEVPFESSGEVGNLRQCNSGGRADVWRGLERKSVVWLYGK